MNILNRIKNLWLRIQESNDDYYKIVIANHKRVIATLTQENVELVAFMENLVDDVNELTEKLNTSNKHSSIETYKDWLDVNILPKAIYYDFGKGRKQVHTIFAESIKDEGIIRDFIENDLEFDTNKYLNVDQLVFWFNRKLSDKYPTRNYYVVDKELYGQIEYWATAKETINNIRINNTYGDCDDSMTLRYSCLYYLLKDRFPDELWRLRGFIVDLWTGGGHALLAWVKEGVNDWIPLETTFYDTREGTIWNNNYRIRDQILYQIRYSFDDKHEYVRI